MTSVVLNKVGMDLVDIEVQQRGSAFTDIFFQDPVLDYTKEYVLGISELTVPLGDEPMLTQNPRTQTLLRVYRKGYFAVNGAGAQTWYPLLYGNMALARHPVAAHRVAQLPFYSIPQTWALFRGFHGGVNIQTPAQLFDELTKWASSV